MVLFDLLAANMAALLLFTFALSLMVGSFLNVAIYRLPIMMEREWVQQCTDLLKLEGAAVPQGSFERFDLASPASHCPQCRHKIGALENIPLASYLLQGGKCKACKAPIPRRYPVIEAVTALLSCLVSYTFGFTWLTLAVLLLTWGLIVLTMIDVDHQLLPDDITLPLVWLGLVVNSFGLLVPLRDAVWGAVFGYLALWAVYWLFKLLTGKEGMGYGDFKLLAALGAWMGWQALPIIILLSSLVGALVGLTLIALRGRDRNLPIPFGPYLAAAGFLSLLWGGQIRDLYVRVFL